MGTYASFLRAMVWGLLLLTGCIEAYEPTVLNASRSFLVVDGIINPRGMTTIVLTRTHDLSATTAPPVETQATVYVQQEAGPRYALPETTPGTYASAPLTLTPGTRYRLQIRTAAGLEYESDYVAAQLTPPIDALSWRPGSLGLTIFASTHDEAAAARHYRWEFSETWEIVPAARPDIEYDQVNNLIRPITVPYPTKCWRTEEASVISLAQTTNLSQNVVAEHEVRRLPTDAPRLTSMYSILVRQHAQSREEYAYWELMQKNTENLGTLFDPLPVPLTGNVHCLTDPAELALGFVGAHSITQKRLFITRTELPKSWAILSGYESCFPPDTVVDRKTPKQDELKERFNGGQVVPITALTGPPAKWYTAMNVTCVDCRNQGSATKPDFWP